MIRTLLALLALVTLTACSAEVKGPKVEVTPPKIEVGPADSGGTFCPPGQAKKGRC